MWRVVFQRLLQVHLRADDTTITPIVIWLVRWMLMGQP